MMHPAGGRTQVWQNGLHHGSTYVVRQGHRPPGPDVRHDASSSAPSTRCSSASLFASGASGITIAIVAGGLLALQFFTSDKLALRAMGAREVSPQEAPELHAMIERLCVQADLPKPKVAVAHTSMPNAFALGRSQKTATVCATTGIMELLSPAELEGVMAHELTHVANRDVAIMTLASFFASLASMIVQFGFFFGGGGDDDDGPRLPGGRHGRARPSTSSRSSSCRRSRATASSPPTAAPRSSPAARARWPRRS